MTNHLSEAFFCPDVSIVRIGSAALVRGDTRKGRSWLGALLASAETFVSPASRERIARTTTAFEFGIVLPLGAFGVLALATEADRAGVVCEVTS